MAIQPNDGETLIASQSNPPMLYEMLQFSGSWRQIKSVEGRTVRYWRSPLSRVNPILTDAVGSSQISLTVVQSTGMRLETSGLVLYGLKCRSILLRDSWQAVHRPESVR